VFAINHAATALVIKRKYPSVPMLWLLLSVQLMEFLWVVLNYAGVERTTTAPTVRTLADIHLAYMPYSHSVLSGVGLALVAWAVLAKGLGKSTLGAAVGLGVLSHLILDLLTHAPDIALAPFISGPKLGLGLYSSLPMLAFVLETGYGVLCWVLFRGSKALLATILLFNLANLPLFSSAIGSKQILVGHPGIVVTIVALQILATLVLVGVLSRRTSPSEATSSTLPLPG